MRALRIAARHPAATGPYQRHAGKGFEDYMVEGLFAAIDAVEEATGEKEVNLIGYCLGGTFLAAALDYLHATPAGKPGSVSKCI